MVDVVNEVSQMEMFTVTVLLVSAGVAVYGFCALRSEKRRVKEILER